MTLLGKLFSCLIFLLSVVFFTFAVAVNASHVNTKELAAQYDQEARDSQARNQQLEALRDYYKNELQMEQSSKRAALAALQTQYEAVENELFQLEAQASQNRADFSKAARDNSATQSDQRSAAETTRNLRQKIVQTRQRRDELLKSLTEAKHEISRLQGPYRSLSDRSKDLGF